MEYRLTIFSLHGKEELMTFDFPLLPNAGEWIKLDDGELFFIKERCFLPHIKDGLIHVELLGDTESDEI